MTDRFGQWPGQSLDELGAAIERVRISRKVFDAAAARLRTSEALLVAAQAHGDMDYLDFVAVGRPHGINCGKSHRQSERSR